MSVSRVKIAEAIGKKTLSDFNPKQLASEIAAYLLSEGRVDELESLVRDIIDYRAKHGILEVDVSSAHELDSQLISEVQKMVKAYQPKTKKIIINKHLDKQLVGGLKLGLANRQLDLSLRAKLNRFKQLTNVGKV